MRSFTGAHVQRWAGIFTTQTARAKTGCRNETSGCASEHDQTRRSGTKHCPLHARNCAAGLA
jgi:hypothetical protein